MRGMKVANFTDTYEPQNNGVAVALRQMQEAKKDWESAIFAPVKSNGVKRVSGMPVPLSPEYTFALNRGIEGVRDFDLVHVHTPYPMFYYGWKAARENCLPLVGTFHTDPTAFFGSVLSDKSLFGRFSSRIMWRYLIHLYNQCDAVIVPSLRAKEQVLEKGLKKPIYVVPNGVDTKRFHPTAKTGEFKSRYGIGDGIVLFVGRLEKRKRPDTLVDAALECPETTFVIVGEGKMRRELEGKASRHNNIVFTGYLDSGELAQAFAAADVFVFPSEMETQGMVILEAMAAGCAVLSTDVGSASELLDKKNLFPVGDSQALSKKIKALMESGKRLAAEKKENRKVAMKYSIEEMVQKTCRIYGKIQDNFASKKVSVVVPTLNEANSIEKCLKSLSEQDYPNMEIIVADGHSTDGTDEIAKGYGRVIYCKTSGPGPARNAAVKKSSGEIIAFTDADTIVPRDWVRRIAYAFTLDEELAGVGGVLEPAEGGFLDPLMFKINSDLFYRLSALFGFYQLATPNCAYRKSAFLEERGFDESLSMFEDTDLSIRVSKNSKLRIDPKLRVMSSVRRMKQESYGMLFLKYVKVYLNYLLGRGVSERHFDTIEH
jgi:glycosyltransferase involved in cell wall biosynthesis